MAVIAPLFCRMLGLKNIRLPDYDYRSDGWYFVTINSDYRRPFGLQERNSIKHTLQAIPSNEPGVTVYAFVIMEDHIHIILLFQDAKRPLGEVVRRLKARSTRHAGEPLWKPNYYEHVIRSQDDLKAVREYILLNPDVRKQRDAR